MAYQFTVDWHSHIAHVWREHLVPLAGQPVQALEIGSYEGRSAIWMLRHVLTHPDARLTCIDPRYQPTFGKNIEESGFGAKLMALVGTSVQKIAELIQSAARFDIIYVDGLHTPEQVLTDAILAWQVAKPGAIIVFDDYAHPRTPTRLGTEPFMAAFGPLVEVLHCEYQFLVRKR